MLDEAEGGNAKIARKEMMDIIDQLVRLEEQKKDFAEQVKEVYALSKSKGYDNAALKVVVKEKLANRDPSASEEFESVVALYRDIAFGRS